MFGFAERECVLPRRKFGLRAQDSAIGQPACRPRIRRGYLKGSWSEPLSVRPIDYTRDEPADSEGLQFVSGAAVDPAKKALAHAKAFGYAEKEENRIPSSIAAFEALASAPSYRPDLDLGWLAGSGEIVSFVGVWFDPVSRLAILEPVGTIPAYRRRRLAESLIEEGARRAAALGATALYVGSDQDFYRRIGFEVVLRQDVWEYRRK